MSTVVSSRLHEYAQAVAHFQAAAKGAYAGPSLPFPLLQQMVANADGIDTAELVRGATVAAGKQRSKHAPRGFKDFLFSVAVEIGAGAFLDHLRRLQDRCDEDADAREKLVKDTECCARSIDDIVHVSDSAILEIIAAIIPMLSLLTQFLYRMHPVAMALVPAIALAGDRLIEAANRAISSTCRDRDDSLEQCYTALEACCEQACSTEVPKDVAKPAKPDCTATCTAPAPEATTAPAAACPAPETPACPPPATAPAGSSSSLPMPPQSPQAPASPAPVSQVPVSPAAANPAPVHPSPGSSTPGSSVPGSSVPGSSVPGSSVPVHPTPVRPEQPATCGCSHSHTPSEPCTKPHAVQPQPKPEPHPQPEPKPEPHPEPKSNQPTPKVCHPVECPPAEATPTPTPKPDSCPSTPHTSVACEPAVSCSGILGAVGIGVAIVGIGALIAAAVDFFSHLELPDLTPPGAPEPPAPPAPGAPESGPAPHPADGVITPPEELGKVKEPPPPAQKVAMQGSAPGPAPAAGPAPAPPGPAPAAPGPAPAAPGPAPAVECTPAAGGSATSSGSSQRARKAGQW